jgi:hypothetical protein
MASDVTVTFSTEQWAEIHSLATWAHSELLAGTGTSHERAADALLGLLARQAKLPIEPT